MASTTFVDKTTRTAAAWFNDINAFFYTLFASATTAAQARTALGAGFSSDPNSDLPVVDGGTGASTAVVARGNLAIGPIGIVENISLSPSVAASALTLSVKGEDGTAPSATNVVSVRVPNNTGGINRRTITSAVTLTISSGSTLGHNSALKQYTYWYLIDNSGTLELAASSKFFGFQGIVSTTAEGGAGASDSGTVMYSTTARASVPFVCIAYSEDTQATAGTWASTLSAIFIYPFSHPVVSFSAHKNAVDQSGIVTLTDTKVTYGTEVYDNGNLYDSVTNSRWVPPPGTVTITAALEVSAAVDQTFLLIQVFKNGASFRRGGTVDASGGNAFGNDGCVIDESNGTDYYEIFIQHNAGSNRIISGAIATTYFMATWAPQRS